ncbi:MAG: thioesterase domain-containing protein [Jatrophihabitantaceae bacterium]
MNPLVVPAVGPLVCWHRSAKSPAALVCLPWAGAGAAPYRAWAQVFESGPDLYATRLGGRESRLMESPPVDVPTAVAELVCAVQALPNPRVYLVGHCSGAILAFELARALRRSGYSGLAGLTVVEQVCPSRLTVSQQDDDLRRLIPPGVREDPDLVELLTPIIAADTAMLAAYEYLPEAPLDVPITAIGAACDDEVTDVELARWASETTARYETRMVGATDQLFSGESWLVLAGEALRATS